MKNLLILLIVINLQVIATSVFSQHDVSLDLENVSLKKCIKEIDNQVELGFLYNGRELNKIKIEKVTYENTPLQDVLNNLLETNGYTYEIYKDVILVTKSNNPTNKQNEPSDKFQEIINVTGTVLDENSNPLPGVNVYVKGTTIGVATDIDGNYSINVPNKEAVLVFSFVGYHAIEELVGEQKIKNISLNPSENSLSEIVVTGYQQLPRERTTGSFNLVKSDELEDRITNSVTAKLEAMVPGLLKEGGKINIRGVTSLFATTEPLIVVDGFPVGVGTDWNKVGGTIDNLMNPEDIESITVLKDAAAASIWGVNASNGVIVITTKSNKGKTSKPKVNVSSSFIFQDHPDYNSIPLASTQSIVDLEYFGYQNQVINSGGLDNRLANYNLVEEIFLKEYRGEISSEEAQERLQRLGQNNIIKENEKYFLQRMFKQQYNLSVKGGREKSSYYFSAYYNKNIYHQIGDEDQRINLNFKNDFQVTKWLKAFVNTNINIEDSKNNGMSVNNFPRYQSLFDDDGFEVPVYRSISQEQKEIFQDLGYKDWGYYPLQEKELNDNKTKSFITRLQAGLDIKLWEGVNFSSKFQYEYSNREYSYLYSEDSYYTRDLLNRYTYYDPSTEELERAIPDGSIYMIGMVDYENYNFRNQLNISRKLFNDNHYLDFILGAEIQQFKTETTNTGYIYGYDPDVLTVNSLDWSGQTYRDYRGFVVDRPVDKEEFTHRLDRFISFYSNLGYTIKEKYSITGSIRIDQTNLFGTDPKYRYRPLWSAGASWLLSNEEFFNIRFIDYLKLRASFGSNGNVDKGTSPEMLIEVFGEGEFQYARINEPPNEKLRWEKTDVTNIAFDYGIFNNRISGSLEAYWQNSTDLLGWMGLDPTAGWSQARVNNAELKNRGIDFDLSALVINKKNFKWNQRLNLGYNKSTITNFYFEANATNLTSDQFSSDYYVVNDAASAVYAYKWAGLSSDGQPQVYDAEGNIVEARKDNLQNIRGELVNVGQRIPKVHGGFISQFSYKSLTLNLILSYKLGHVFKVPTVDYRSIKGGNFIHSDLDKRWQQPGDELNTYVPAYPTEPDDPRMDVYLYSDHLYHNASHIRISELALNYKLPNKFLKKIKLKGAIVQFQVNNFRPIWVANSEGLDPEDPWGAVKQPIYTGGFKFNF